MRGPTRRRFRYASLMLGSLLMYIGPVLVAVPLLLLGMAVYKHVLDVATIRASLVLGATGSACTITGVHLYKRGRYG